MMIRILSTLVLIAFSFSTVSQTSQKNYQKMSVSQLIDELANIDSPGVGFHPTALAIGFIADDTEPEFGGGVLGSSRPDIHPQAKELVRRGADALPELIKHLSDNRPTLLRIGNSPTPSQEERGSNTKEREFHFMFQCFSDEYDPKTRPKVEEKTEDYLKRMRKSFSGKYTLKTGDICYALIGQIVNRNLLPMRYQPTGGLIINSPVEVPDLVKKVTEDWGNATKDDLLKSLLNDLENARNYKWRAVPALNRIQFYFPEDYIRLDLEKIRQRLK